VTGSAAPGGVHLRPGCPEDAPALSALALRSKGYWGYEREFLEACRSELTVDPAGVEDRRAVVAIDRRGMIVGFRTLEGDPPDGEVGMLFVAPEQIGTGVGRLLWSDLVRRAADAGFRSLRIEADPGAASFYEAMGAVVEGSTPSGSIAGRHLPLLVFEVTPAEIAPRPEGSEAGP
jgi:GNAT superfamily N-acetyltransferase